MRVGIPKSDSLARMGPGSDIARQAVRELGSIEEDGGCLYITKLNVLQVT